MNTLAMPQIQPPHFQNGAVISAVLITPPSSRQPCQMSQALSSLLALHEALAARRDPSCSPSLAPTSLRRLHPWAHHSACVWRPGKEMRSTAAGTPSKSAQRQNREITWWLQACKTNTKSASYKLTAPASSPRVTATLTALQSSRSWV